MPHAFGSTLEREQARPPEEWPRWIEPGPMWLLEDDATPLGLDGLDEPRHHDGAIERQMLRRDRAR